MLLHCVLDHKLQQQRTISAHSACYNTAATSCLVQALVDWSTACHTGCKKAAGMIITSILSSAMAAADDDLGVQIAQAVYSCYQKLAKTGKAQAHEHAVLAAIAVTYNPQDAQLQTTAVQIVALATGTKCLGGNARSPCGDLINDSHAEVLARRAFMLWLHGEIQLAARHLATSKQGGGGWLRHAAGMPSVVAYNQSTGRFRMRDCLRVHLYISQPPCGDACILNGADGSVQGTQHGTPGVVTGMSYTNCVAPNTAKNEPHLACLASVPLKGDSIQIALLPAAVAAADASAGQQAALLRQPEAMVTDKALPTSEPLKLRTGAKALRLTYPAQQQTLPPIQTKPDKPPTQQATLETTARVGTVQAPEHATETTQPALPENEQQQHGNQACQHQGEYEIYLPQQGDVECGPQQLGVLRRKPGRGDATLSLSCSDKIARWACCGLQGALLSGLLDAPVYLDNVVVAMQQEVADAGADAQQQARQAIERAVGSRLRGHLEHCLTPPYHLHMPQVLLVPQPPAHLGLSPSKERRVPAGGSINWSAAPGLLLQASAASVTDTGGSPNASREHLTLCAVQVKGTQEVTADGYKAGASKAAVAAGKARSRLCRAALVEQLRLTVQECQLAGVFAGHRLRLCMDHDELLPEACSSTNKEGAVHSDALLQGKRKGAEAIGDGLGAHDKDDLQQTEPVICQEAAAVAHASTAQPDVDMHVPCGNAPVWKYTDLKERLGQSYMHAWRSIRQQQPFRLWIGKPVHLSQFTVAGFS